ncbi:MAG: ABC transporter permease subunit [Acidobacteria bacterium]|nr:MAG: ABC transporter permease subunit [Acidobacteriota bacterium]
MFRSADARLGWGLTAALGLLPPIAVVALGGFMLASALTALRQVPIAELASATWSPLAGRFGLLPLILGTATSTVLALLLAVPLGLAAALYLALYAGPRTRAAADAAVALLGGMPSVVIGLWGMTWIVPATGNSLAAAVLVLALMITPTFTLLAGAALRQVPASLVEAARALGLGEDVAAALVVRHARWGILGAATLAATRGLGEAVAVSMVAGNVGNLPSLLGPVATLTTTLIVEFDGATGVHRSALYLAAAVVMALIAAVSLAGRSLQRRGRS